MKKLMLIFVLILLISASAAAQGNAFNFQGRLNDGTTPANGSYDLNFRLYDAITGGTAIGSLVARPNTTLINGVFSVALDFGATAFNNPASIFIEIGIRPNGSTNAYTILGPRQQLTVVPFAVRAMNSTNADNAVNAQNAQNAQNAVNSQNSVLATNATNAANSDKLNNLRSTDFIRNSTTAQPTSNFNISGSGVVGGSLTVRGAGQVDGEFAARGDILSSGNILQLRDKSGAAKALIYVKANGTISRCYNGTTGASTGNCGFTTSRFSKGIYSIDFGFRVDDRFISITPEQEIFSEVGVNIGAGYQFTGGNSMYFRLFITDADFVDSKADNPFVVIVY